MQKTIQTFFTAIMATLSSILGVLYIPVLLLVLCNIIDYITGLISAKYRADGSISSYKSMKGIFKKVTMWLLVVVGSIIDELIKYSVASMGVAIPVSFLIGCVVAIWLICNEVISIIENMKDIGVPIPAFILPLVKNIKGQTEKLAEKNISDKKEKEEK